MLNSFDCICFISFKNGRGAAPLSPLDDFATAGESIPAYPAQVPFNQHLLFIVDQRLNHRLGVFIELCRNP
jgi:hypothetical protein